jgi:CRISPR/Cas system type I-B associated protein Csh2 (Cas7 group RAMP superfamily)
MSLDEALSLQNQSKNDLVEQIKIQKTVEKILADKIVVTDEEVKDYFQKNKDLFEKGATLEEVSSEIKNQLAQSKLSSEYQAWISDLKAKASINYFVNF